MWTFLKKIGSVIAKVFGAGGAAEKVMKRVLEIVPVALPIVEMVAALTPGRTDDELIALFKRHGLPWIEKWLGLPDDARGMALFEASSQILAKQYPTLPMSTINAAVQIAYTAWKAGQPK